MRRIKRVPVVSFLLLLLSSLRASAQDFSPLDLDLGRGWNGSLTWADLDNDGDLDLVSTRLSDGNVLPYLTRVWRNDDNGVFTELDAGFPGLASGRISVGDLDRDGRLDLGFGGEILDGNGSAVNPPRIFRNLGGMNFAVLAVDLPIYTGAMDFGDYDRDGDLDILLSASNPYLTPRVLAVLENDGKGAFSAANIEVGPVTPGAGQWMDFDLDGEPDIAVLSPEAEGIPRPMWRRNLGGGYFETVFSDAGTTEQFNRSWADADGDGDPDFVVGLSPFKFTNLGSAGFAASSEPLAPESAYHAAWGDFDGDGDPDLAMTTRNGTRLLENDGAGNLAPLPDVLDAGGGSGAVAPGDFDGDGRLDLAISTGCPEGPCAGTRIYWNTTGEANTPPSAPAGLRASQDASGDIRLAWDAATDPESKQSGWITYEVRVGTAPGLGDVVSPPSDLLTGRRRVATDGAERARFRLVRGLPKGTYYWSVQAVDAGFAGSTWAPEKAFTITKTPPTLGKPPAQHLALSEIREVELRVGDAESPASALAVRGESSDESIVPASSFVVSGSGRTRSLRFQPLPGQVGSLRITAVVQDPDGLETRRSFAVHVEEFAPAVGLSFPYETFGLALPAIPPADFDNDGDLDVVVAGERRRPDDFFEHFQVLLLNDGHGHFTIGPDLPTTFSGLVCDLDRDGRLDVVSGTHLHFNDGGGRFRALPTGLAREFLDLADLNGDGLPEAIGREFEFGGRDRVYQWSAGKWKSAGLDLGQSGAQIQLRDINLDGAADIVTFGLNSASVRLNDGWGGFKPDSSLSVPLVPGDDFGQTWFEDANDDGALDFSIFVSPRGIEPAWHYEQTNDGHGQFTSNRVQRPYGVRWQDYNNDGRSDRMVFQYDAGGNHTWRLHQNTGEGGHIPRSLVLNEPGGLIGDFDGDGDIDVVTLLGILNPNISFGRQLSFVRNNSDRKNLPPGTPAGLRAEILPDARVVLRWNGSIDDHTPVSALTYRVRVGTNPGGHDILSPGPAQARPGESTSACIRRLNALPGGTYYWSVQAVDQQFAAGEWASEGSFHVGLPVIGVPPELSIIPGQPSESFPLRINGRPGAPAAEWNVKATSAEPGILSDGQILVSGSGTDRLLRFTPGAKTGTATVLLTATHPSGAVSEQPVRVTISWFLASPLPGGGEAVRCVVADFDRDGRLDLLAEGLDREFPAKPFTWRNTGSGRFEDVTNSLPEFVRGAVVPGALGGVNQVDLLVGVSAPLGRASGPEARVWRSGLPFRFSPLTPPLTEASTVLQWSDPDGDGFSEFPLWGTRNSFGPGLELLAGPDRGVRWDPPARAFSQKTSVVWADFDRDGDDDFVVSGYESSGFPVTQSPFALLFRNDGHGVFVPVDAGLPSAFVTFPGAIDLNGDRQPDLCVLEPLPTGGSQLRMWRNTGGNHFEPAQRLTSGSGVLSANFGDFDNNGATDILVVSVRDVSVTTPGASLWLNDGKGEFQFLDAGFPALALADAKWADVDGDGVLDVVATGADNTQLWRQLVLRSRVGRRNTSPAVPIDTKVVREPESVILSWTPPNGADAEDERFLTYNLRLGRTPGGSEVVSPAAELSSGRRYLTGPGNCGPAPLRRFTGLPPGTYYWAVQTVDAGFAASAFSEEKVFRVSQITLSGLKDVELRASQLDAVLPFEIHDSIHPLETLTVEVRTDNAALLPQGAITVEGTSAIRLLRLRPTPHVGGLATLEIRFQNPDGDFVRARIQVRVIEEFAATPQNLPAVLEGRLAWGDADHDGDMDLVLGGNGLSMENAARLFLNQAGQLIAQPVDIIPGPRGGSVNWVDYDSDGNLDLFINGGDERFATSTLYRQWMKLEFTPALSVLNRPMDLRAGDSAWADADGDGDADLAQIGFAPGSGRRGRLYRNNGRDALHIFPDSEIPAVDLGTVTWADFDGDGDNDLLVTGTTDGTAKGAITTLLVNHNGRFQSQDSGLPALFRSSVAVADMDLDGSPDIVLCGMGRSGSLAGVYHNNGSGRFTATRHQLPPVYDGSVALGDVNGDLIPDVAVCGMTPQGRVSGVWLNRNDTFVRASTAMPPASGGQIAFGDLDGDNDLDLALTGNIPTADGFGSGYTDVFVNRLDKTNAVPISPEEGSAVVIGNDVHLSWKLPRSASGRYSFNVRVGQNLGSDDIMAAQADANTGRLLIQRPGNAGWSGHWQLRNLEAGTYYWNVQAVDASYQGSAWSVNREFVIANPRPTLEPIPNASGPANQALGPIAVLVDDPGGDPRDVTLSVNSSVPAVVATEGILVSGEGSTRQITLRPQTNARGSTVIEVVATDASGAVARTQFLATFQVMTLVETAFPPFRPAAIETMDLDGDGFEDVTMTGWEQLAAGSFQASGASYQNDGSGGFTPWVDPVPLVGDVRLAAADFDADGLPDIAMGNGLYRNTNSGFSMWEPPTDPLAQAAWGDLNGDGRLDLVVVGGLKPAAFLWMNTPEGFKRAPLGIGPLYDGSAAWGDMDNDGDLDLAVSGRELEAIRAIPRLILLRNDGGIFHEVLRTIGVNRGMLQWADANRDGRADLLMAGRNFDGIRSRLLVNLGSGSFFEDAEIAGSEATQLEGAGLFDLDGDGALDLLQHSPNATFGVRLNDGFGRFASGSVAFANVPAGIARWFDMDGDGDFDLMVGGPNRISLYRNHWKAAHPAVARLESTVIGNRVELRWPAMTTFGPGTPVTYNLRVGSAPGGVDILSPMSDRASGRRLVPAHGNAAFARATQVRGLRPGRYYWSIQAIDAARNGSPWTAEADFTITQPLPALSIEKLVTIDSRSLRIEVGGLPGGVVLVESSTDLVSWSPLDRMELDGEGKAIGSVPVKWAQGFFRLRWVSP